MNWRDRLRNVFYAEIVINLISIAGFMFTGETVLRSLGASQVDPPLVEVGRWFAALTLVITYIMGRALLTRNEQALRFVLEGYLLGDFIYLIVALQFVNAIGGVWTPGMIFALGITVVLAVIRVLYLTRRVEP